MTIRDEKRAEEKACSRFVEVDIADLQNFLIDTERYAIGRVSYYPLEAIEIIEKYQKHLTPKTTAVIVRDIEWWLEGTHDGLDYAEEWNKLKRKLEEREWA